MTLLKKYLTNADKNVLNRCKVFLCKNWYLKNLKFFIIIKLLNSQEHHKHFFIKKINIIFYFKKFIHKKRFYACVNFIWLFINLLLFKLQRSSMYLILRIYKYMEIHYFN